MKDFIFAPRLKSFLLEDDGQIPNNPRLPLLVYGGALQFSTGNPALACEEVFAANNGSDLR